MVCSRFYPRLRPLPSGAIPELLRLADETDDRIEPAIVIGLDTKWDRPNEPGIREEIEGLQFYCHSSSTLLVLNICAISLNSHKLFHQTIPAHAELLNRSQVYQTGKRAQDDVSQLAWHWTIDAAVPTPSSSAPFERRKDLLVMLDFRLLLFVLSS